MIKSLTFFPAVPQHTSQIVWGDSEVRIRMTFRDRTASWYFDLFDLDEVAIVTGRRVSPEWVPLAGLALDDSLDPDINLVTQGPSPYNRSDLGVGLRLLLVPDDDLPPPTPTAAEGSLVLTFLVGGGP